MPKFVDQGDSFVFDLGLLEGSLHRCDLAGPAELVVHLLLQVPLHEDGQAHLIDDHEDILEVLVNEGELAEVGQVLLAETVQQDAPEQF